MSLVPANSLQAWKRVFVSGGAGFIGSHLVVSLLKESPIERVVVYDNFSSGQMSYLEEGCSDRRLEIVQGDLKDLNPVTAAMAGCEPGDLPVVCGHGPGTTIRDAESTVAERGREHMQMFRGGQRR